VTAPKKMRSLSSRAFNLRSPLEALEYCRNHMKDHNTNLNPGGEMYLLRALLLLCSTLHWTAKVICLCWRSRKRRLLFTFISYLVFFFYCSSNDYCSRHSRRRFRHTFSLCKTLIFPSLRQICSFFEDPSNTSKALESPFPGTSQFQ